MLGRFGMSLPGDAVPAHWGDAAPDGATAERVTAAGSLGSKQSRSREAVGNRTIPSMRPCPRNLILARARSVPALHWLAASKDKDPEVRRLCLEGLTTSNRKSS